MTSFRVYPWFLPYWLLLLSLHYWILLMLHIAQSQVLFCSLSTLSLGNLMQSNEFNLINILRIHVYHLNQYVTFVFAKIGISNLKHSQRTNKSSIFPCHPLLPSKLFTTLPHFRKQYLETKYNCQ